MKKIITVILSCTLLLYPSALTSACTLWSASGDRVAGGGTLLVKNRDWVPNHSQELKLVEPENGFRYYGLFAKDGDAPGLKGGINEHGLVVVTASASSISRKQRLSQPHTKGLISMLLKSCDSVDAALAKTDLFMGAQYILLADRTKSAVVEIAPHGHYAVREIENGVLWHTNHYVDPDLAAYNVKIGSSSAVRYKRIEELLTAVSYPFSLEDFIAFSNDRIDGPDNSIWRTGSSLKKPHTLATWIVYLPKYGDPVLYVKLANPGVNEQICTLHFSEIFKKNIPRG